MKETLLTDVTKIHIISEVIVPTTTTTTRWIEITPQVPTAVKSTTSNTPTNKETKSKSLVFRDSGLENQDHLMVAAPFQSQVTWEILQLPIILQLHKHHQMLFMKLS